jgi:hypothetical protein
MRLDLGVCRIQQYVRQHKKNTLLEHSHIVVRSHGLASVHGTPRNRSDVVLDGFRVFVSWNDLEWFEFIGTR